jgi:threonine synthase
VKAAFADEAFRSEVKLGAINSINWARVLAQITYYFYSYLRTTDELPEETKDMQMMFAVPTGNFGDILAGYYAKRMGLPVEKLIVCTNENDVLHRFFETGSYTKQPATLSIAPSMDISVSSNFERYLFYLAGENSAQLKAWMDEFESTGQVRLPKTCHDQAKADFSSASSSKSDIVAAMREVYDAESYLLCPHTATAAVAVKKLNLPAERIICLATAHPAKFEEAVSLALQGKRIPARPTELQRLFVLPTRSKSLPNQLDKIEEFVRAKIKPTPKQTSFIPAVMLVSAIAIGLFVYTRSK